MKAAVNAANALMESLGLDYMYGEYDQNVLESGFYWVGDAMPEDAREDGSESGAIDLDGWSLVDGVMPLVDANEAIRSALFVDKRFANASGTVVLSYGSSMDVPSDVHGIFRMRITINYTEWSE